MRGCVSSNGHGDAERTADKVFDKFCPEYLGRVTAREWLAMIANISEMDTYKAAKEIEKLTGAEGNEELLSALCRDQLATFDLMGLRPRR